MNTDPHFPPISPTVALTQRLRSAYSKGMKSILASIALCAWCIMLALVPLRALWPYRLSRWMVCGSCIALFLASRESRRADAIAVILAIIGITFNPIAPIHFGRQIWAYADGVAAVGFLTVAIMLRQAPSRK